MKTITVEQALKMGWCYGEKKLRKIAGEKQEWSALDILNLPDVPDEDKLYSVLNVALIDEPILHEFACRCAERALAKSANPDPRSVAAIEAKRAWLRGEITDDDLRSARYAAQKAAVYAGYAALEAAWEAALVAALVAARGAERRWQVDE
jgi:hypothetical protein